MDFYFVTSSKLAHYWLLVSDKFHYFQNLHHILLLQYFKLHGPWLHCLQTWLVADLIKLIRRLLRNVSYPCLWSKYPVTLTNCYCLTQTRAQAVSIQSVITFNDVTIHSFFDHIIWKNFSYYPLNLGSLLEFTILASFYLSHLRTTL